MNSSRGFFVDLISVLGPNLPVAQVELSDGLNVVSGASDTGKSYLCGLIDLALGAASLPKNIAQANDYSRVVVRVRSRTTKDAYEIERLLTGGSATIRHLDPHGIAKNTWVASPKHSAGNTTTLSSFLLNLSGFGAATVQKNKKGDVRSLSFRDVAYLILVDETRIISENPPHLSSNYPENPAERDVLRFLVTGAESIRSSVVTKKTEVQDAKAQLELVLQLIARTEHEIAALNLGDINIDEELERLEKARAGLLREHESSRVELVSMEREIATNARRLREIESRLLVIDGLLRRFELLDGHYQSDLARLDAIREAGSMLEALPTVTCPVCGAAPDNHRPSDAAEHFRVDDIRTAAEKEADKIVSLRADLQNVLSELSREGSGLETQRSQVSDWLINIQSKVSKETQPRLRATTEVLQQQISRRDVLFRGRVLTEQLLDLRARAGRLEALTRPVARSASPTESGASVADMSTFAQHVKEVLTQWHFPDSDHVTFNSDTQDLVINGQSRASHGKGIRALTCAAFIGGLMRHCLEKGRPHPGLVVLDSPLVAYKEPDVPKSDGARIRQAGVREAFYRTLADGLCKGQVIVFENEDPPADIEKRITYHHFTKSTSVGRYGFFPVRV